MSIDPSVSIDCCCMPVIEHIWLLSIFRTLFNFVGLKTEISAPESIRKVHSEFVTSVLKTIKFDNAVDMLKIPFTVFGAAHWLTQVGIEVVVVVGEVVVDLYFEFE